MVGNTGVKLPLMLAKKADSWRSGNMDCRGRHKKKGGELSCGPVTNGLSLWLGKKGGRRAMAHVPT